MKKYVYFVSYFASAYNGFTFGMVEIITKKEIVDMGALINISRDIKDSHKDLTEVTIISYQLLKAEVENV